MDLKRRQFGKLLGIGNKEVICLNVHDGGFASALVHILDQIDLTCCIIRKILIKIQKRPQYLKALRIGLKQFIDLCGRIVYIIIVPVDERLQVHEICPVRNRTLGDVHLVLNMFEYPLGFILASLNDQELCLVQP